MRTRRYKCELIGFPRRRYYSCPGIVGISQRLHKGTKLCANLIQRIKLTNKKMNSLLINDMPTIRQFHIKINECF